MTACCICICICTRSLAFFCFVFSQSQHRARLCRPVSPTSHTPPLRRASGRAAGQRAKQCIMAVVHYACTPYLAEAARQYDADE